MSYALATLWHERQRFLPAVLAVTFSALLMGLQGGLLMGLFTIMATPIDRARADIWAGYPNVPSIDLGRGIPEEWFTRLARQPGVVRVEPSVQGFAPWSKRVKRGAAAETVVQSCVVIGSTLDRGSLGALDKLTPQLRRLLVEPGTIVVDESELRRLGLRGVGDTGEIVGRRVRVVGLVRGLRSLMGPYVLCSLETARSLLKGIPPGQVTYLLAGCRLPADAERAVQRLQRYAGAMSVFTKEQFSRRTSLHWLIDTKAGMALGLAAALGLVVGAVVTSQTLYAATTASLREYATLRALGISRDRLAATVLAQSFWVGLAGIALALPLILLLKEGAEALGTPVRLDPLLLGGSGAVTLGMAMLAGLAALRSLKGAEPAILLR